MKPVYKISASLLNSYYYYLSNPTDANYESFVKRIKNIYETNVYLERGLKFEEEVFEGKHGKLSELVKDLPQQVWANRTIETEEFNILISGKIDVLDKEKKRIFDIKRVTEFKNNKYDNDMQHILYFYIMPEIQDFYYLVAAGEKIITNEIAHYKRPSERELEDIVMHNINNFYRFLREKNLWETYTEFYKAKPKKYRG